jgi:hypothetical protein
MGDVIDMPKASTKREEAYGALAFLLNALTLLLLVTAIPVNVWLWTVAL